LQDDDKEGDQLDIIYHLDLERGDRDRQVLRLRVPDMADGNTSSATAMKRNEDWFLNGLCLKGIPNITKVSYSDNQKERGKKNYDENGKEIVVKTKNWIIETDGLALKEILAVDKVDYSRTMSNSVKEVLQVLGVEAAR
jgi:DNA-directed RNA polymerase II subunit RPB1